MVGVARLYVDEQRRQLAQVRRRMAALLEIMDDQDIIWRPAARLPTAVELARRMCDQIVERLGANLNRRDWFPPLAATAPPTPSVALLRAELDATLAAADDVLRRLPLAMLVDPAPGPRPASNLEHLSIAVAACHEAASQLRFIAALRLGPAALALGGGDDPGA
jgi:hypothetical protein